MQKKSLLLPVILLLLVSACKKKVQPEETRSFFIGTTQWPADFTEAELNNSYNFINNNCDIVCYHFDDGVPYEEAYNNQPMPVKLLQDVQLKKSKTQAGKKVYLGISALKLNRKERTGYYDSNAVNPSVVNYWKQLPFDDAKVITAYFNFACWLIDQFQPSFINYGIESNHPYWDATAFSQYNRFLSSVYGMLKARYPDIPIFLSLMVDENPANLSNASQLLPYSDYVALSAYPYVTISSSANGNTNPAKFPADFFSRFINLAPNKPLVFAETGYIAENLVVPSYSLNKQGTESWQNEYLKLVFNLCNERKAKFMIWFCHKDYDAGNATLQAMGLYQDLFAIWEDTGLKDETGRERSSYSTWTQWYKRKKID